jgi:hypothetical protein
VEQLYTLSTVESVDTLHFLGLVSSHQLSSPSPSPSHKRSSPSPTPSPLVSSPSQSPSHKNRDLSRTRVQVTSPSTTSLHGGVLVAAVPGTRLSSVTSATVAITAATTFEAVCVRVSTGSFKCVVLAIFRSGSEAITASFFDELADVLGRIAAMREPIFVAGDVSIRLDEQNTCHLHNLFDCYGFVVHAVCVPTHDSGGSIDIVASRSACGDPIFVAGGPVVSVLDPGLSDHRLLRWSVAADILPRPQSRQKTCRAWRRLSVDDFIREVQASALCRPECWQRLDLDEIAALYDSELTAVADRLVPARIVVCRQRPSDPWFDNDCRQAKRLRRLERAASCCIKT